MNETLYAALLASVTVWGASVSGQPEPDSSYARAGTERGFEQIIRSLKGSDRLPGMSDEELAVERQWARDRAECCLRLAQDGIVVPNYAVEFQRHAGRTARFQGFIELALEDYARAWEMCVDLHVDAPGSWGTTLLHDFAETCANVGAYDQAIRFHKACNERSVAHGSQPPVGSPYHLQCLAFIAQEKGHFGEAAHLHEQAISGLEHRVRDYFVKLDEFQDVDYSGSWPEIIRRPAVQGAFQEVDFESVPPPNEWREAYVPLATGYRLAGRLDEAEYALETAELTPWAPYGTYRRNLDWPVDRERAWLALARGNAVEAFERAEECLEKYGRQMRILGPPQEVELHDLASRALEQTGNVALALQRLERAIEIVETRRAVLVSDEFKQSYVAGHAELYRRAMELSIRLGRSFEESFRWAERAKARAMLDHLLRNDYRTARELERGNEGARRAVADLAGDVLGWAELRQADWFGDDLALLEYGLGKERAYLWLFTRRAAHQYTLPYGTEAIEQAARRLREALRPGRPPDTAWIEPARRLYECLIQPAERALRELRESRGAGRLLVVGDGPLRTIPFEVLIADPAGVPRRTHLPQKLLIEEFAISYAPSASLLHEIHKRPRPTSWKYDFWGIACSRFGSPEPPVQAVASASARDQVAMILRSGHELTGLRDLGNAPAEVRAIAGGFAEGRRKTFVDDPQVKAMLLAADAAGELGRVRLLHFATHALYEPDRPYLSGLVLAPAPGATEPAATQPAEASGRSAILDSHLRSLLGLDGEQAGSRSDLLTLREISRLNLNSELVVLSACKSLGDASAYGDWVAGLTRSFLLAGARGTVCTLWELGDDDALMIMPDMYRAMGEQQPGAKRPCMAAVLKKVKEGCLPSPSDSHPAVWSGFVYHGLPDIGR